MCETSEGQDRLERAKERLDTKAAEIGRLKSTNRRMSRMSIKLKVERMMQRATSRKSMRPRPWSRALPFPALRETPQSRRDSICPRGDRLPRGESGMMTWRMILKTTDQDR